MNAWKNRSHVNAGLLALLYIFVYAYGYQRIGTFPRARVASGLVLMANPVTSEGTKYRSGTTEADVFQFFDEAFLHVRGGSGGAGSSASKFGKGRQHVAPSGGSGGDGGSVIFTVDKSCNTLLGFRGRTNFRAENGKDGGMEFANGMKGKDCVVPVPRGTVITDKETGDYIGELSDTNDRIIVANGGLGGRGNAALRSAGEKSGATPPQGGEKRWLKLELKLVADIGLVGVPNAGKSTLLDAITNARPKIASYPFTTIVPNLGVCEVGGKGNADNGGDAMIIADIPGLIEGAHRGVGLGRGFLRHVERCKMIIHIINGESPDPVGEFNAVNRELQLFSPLLATKPQVVVLNKIDIPQVQARQDEILNGIYNSISHSRVLTISAAGRIGLDTLVERTHKFLLKLKSDEEKEAPPLEYEVSDNLASDDPEDRSD